MFLRTTAAFAALLIVMLTAQAADLKLSFKQFVVPAFTGGPALLVWDDDIFPADYLFRYEYREGEAVEDLANRVYHRKAGETEFRFGGYYVVLTTGCGTALQCGVIVDLRTGEIAGQLPTATTGYEFRPNSRLLVVNPEVPDPDEYHLFWDNATFYLEWNGRDFDLIAEEQWPAEAEDLATTTPKTDRVSKNLPDSAVPLPTARPDPTTTGAIN